MNLKMTSKSDFWDSWGQKRKEPASIIRTNIGWKRTALVPRTWVGRIWWEMPGQTVLADTILLIFFFHWSNIFHSSRELWSFPNKIFPIFWSCGLAFMILRIFNLNLTWVLQGWGWWVGSGPACSVQCPLACKLQVLPLFQYLRIMVFSA